jgi:integrase
MATFIKLQNKGGVTYRAVIRRKGLGRPITKVFKTKTAAKKWAQRIEGDGELARALGDGRLRSKTVGNVIDSYLAEYAGKDKSRPKQLKWWQERIGDRKLVDVDADLIQDQLDRLRSTPAKQPKRGKEGAETARRRTPATVNRFQSAISAVFQHAIKNRDMRTNPARGIGRGEETHHYGRCLSEDERTALLKACKVSAYDRLYLLVTMALSTAARLGELLSLSWADLDLKKNLAILSETKNGSPRQLPLIPAIMNQLQALPRPIDSDTLLFRSRSDPYKPFDFRPHWIAALKEAGIENFRFHDLRHSAATLLAESDINDVTLAAILGHKTMSMVQRYSHARTQKKAEAVQNTFNGIFG